ncbi:MAG: Coenzyme F420 hydrogenase/dehydrogenase, beta subunit C-terminal domain [Armatimonadota bacterium]
MQSENVTPQSPCVSTRPRSPVQTQVVSEDLCIGCGVCASLCPASCLEMRFNRYGEYNPVESDGCTECGVCLKVCPFAPGNPNENQIARDLFGTVPGIGRRTDCGFYHFSFVGHSTVNGIRERGASGGLATWILETLLVRGVVNRVICASTNPDPEKLFRFAIVDSPKGLRQCSGSVYYPLELSEVLKRVLAEDGRYAVIGLPCFVKALRLAERCNPTLAKRLVYHAGVVCGLLPSKFYAEYVVASAGGDPQRVTRLMFRGKEPCLPATRPVIRFWYDAAARDPDGQIEHLKGPCFAWEDWFFKHNACSFCDDVFAELADVVLMDAWLPEYSSKPGGESLAITRTTQATDLLRSGIANGEIEGEELPIEQVVASQRTVLFHKRQQLSAMLAMRARGNRRVPRKRVPPSTIGAEHMLRALSELDAMRVDSRTAWLNADSRDLRTFYKCMPTYRRRARRRMVNGALQLVPRIFRKVLRLAGMR